jgi:hypothetical protein
MAEAWTSVTHTVPVFSLAKEFYAFGAAQLGRESESGP